MAECNLLYTHEIGEGLPVVIIHGWQLNGRVEEADFEPVFQNTSGLQRIYVDLPGMGHSAASQDTVRNLDDMYARVVDFISTRLGNSRFALVGTSCGGYIALALARKYASQVDGLLLRVPLIEPRDTNRDLDPFVPLIADNILMSSIPADERKLLGNVLVQTPTYIEEVKRKVEGVYRPAEREVNRKVVDGIRRDPSRYELSVGLREDGDGSKDDGVGGKEDEEGKKFLAPTLIICGRQDETVGYRDSLRLLEQFPRATYAVLDRAGHSLPIGDSSLFQALVRDWIVRVQEWRGRSEP